MEENQLWEIWTLTFCVYGLFLPADWNEDLELEIELHKIYFLDT